MEIDIKSMEVKAKAQWTHLALHVRNLDASVDFYTKHTPLRKIHERYDEVTKMRTAWLSDRPPGRETEYVLVLIEGNPPQIPGAQPQLPIAPVSHMGFSVETPEDVDRIAEQARAAGILKFGPVYLDDVVGYICIIADPDGHQLEFSYGQVLG
ncbi:MAG: VOC family protein [Acidobacteriota bacterium]|nr:VOC family protein [Blastocatellia bacterium]MDW8240342.1 VOC family protein [Acidobacteriota bacterium]